MKLSVLLAVLGTILPSFIYSSRFLGLDSIAIVGIGWIFYSSSSIFGDSNFFGIYLSDPRILFLPNDWEGFGSLDGLSAEFFVRSYFSDSLNGSPSSLSIYGLLFSIAIIFAIIGIIALLMKKRVGSIFLIISGISGLFSLFLFNQSATDNILISNTLPIPIGPVFLLFAGILTYLETK